MSGDRNNPAMGRIIDMAALPLAPRPVAAKRLKVLFIADFPRGQGISDLSVVTDYLDAIRLCSRHEIECASSREGIGDKCPDFSRFDAVLVHYTSYISQPQYFSAPYARAFARFRGLKVVILQDEYRWIDETNRLLARYGVHIILSSLTLANLPRVYRVPGLASVDKCSALPGYIPARMLDLKVPAIADRPLHVTYRGRENDYWFGALAREKVDIAAGFLQATSGSGLRCDISTDESRRVQGSEWIDLLCSGRATLAVEGGASIFDFDGEAERRTREYLKLHPGAPYEQVARKVLAPFEGNIIHRTLTPRCLEAVCLRTALVLHPGEYRGILEPDRHYIPLERDFSNAREVVAQLKDAALLQRMVDRAYEEIAARPDYWFSTFVSRLDFLMESKWLALGRKPKEGLVRRLLGLSAGE